MNAQSNLQGIRSYDKGYKWLHWSMAFLFMLMLLAFFGFEQVTNDQEHMTMLTGHSSIGTVVCILLLVRVFKRFIKGDPQPVHDMPVWQISAAKWMHLGLYFMMVLVPLTGYLTANFHQLPVMVFGAFELNASSGQTYERATFELLRLVHSTAIKVFMGLLVLHIGAAVYHRAIKKDHVLASMSK